MLHDIRPTGTVNLRETINLNFHSKIILPTVYFPFSTFLIQNLKDPDTTSPHSTYLEKPLEVNVLHIFIISERRRGYWNDRAHSMVFSEKEKGCGLGHQHQIALVNLILTHFTQASRAYWVGRSDSCHILGISASEVGPLPLATAGFWPCCASSILLFSDKCAMLPKLCFGGWGRGVSPAQQLISKCIPVF